MHTALPGARWALSVLGITVIVLMVMQSFASDAMPQECGDADGNGTVSVTDGVQVLRMAAGLGNVTQPEIVDLDRNGVVSVTDGVNVLRLAAGLSVAAPCSPPLQIGCGDIPGCPPYTTSCTPTQLPVDQDVVGVGGRACSAAAEDTELGSTAPLIIDHERALTLFGFQAVDDNGDLIGVHFSIRQLPIMSPDGSIVFDFPAGTSEAAEPRAECGNLRDGTAKVSINGFHQRLVIRKICGETEPIVGCFQTEVQLTDGSRCEVRGEFQTFRTSDSFPPF